MCSIFGIFGLQAGDDLQALRRQALEQSQRQRHRGPDWSGVYVDERAILVHERLAIVDPAGGSQPLLSEDGTLALAVNGEIYNHRELKQELAQPYAFQNSSTASSPSRCGTATAGACWWRVTRWAWCRCTGGMTSRAACAWRRR